MSELIECNGWYYIYYNDYSYRVNTFSAFSNIRDLYNNLFDENVVRRTRVTKSYLNENKIITLYSSKEPVETFVSNLKQYLLENFPEEIL